MNYVNTENWRCTMSNIKTYLWLVMLLPVNAFAQQMLTLPQIIQQIDSNNLQLKAYQLRADAYKHRGDAATAWMPPMVGVGTFMTPYPFQKIMDDRDRGSVMLRVEQEIPGKAKLQARKNYIQSQGNVEMANREITLNELRTLAKREYFNWMIAAQKLNIISANERVLETMRKIEEVRYPYNQSQLNMVYRAQAELEKNRSMLLMPKGDIARARAFLNTLMNRPANTPLLIDTTYQPTMGDGYFDTTALAGSRKDIIKMDESIRSMQLNIEAMQLERKPTFRIQFDHMTPMSGMMPQAFSIMGMVSIPIAPWSRKMYQSEVKAMQSEIGAMQVERSSMLHESQGMIAGMQRQIKTMQDRIRSLEQKVIPALQRTHDAGYLNYQENKLPLNTLLESWEALNMMKLDVLDEKQKLYQMIVDYEKEIFK